jgi:ArsR family transcriptional regulator
MAACAVRGRRQLKSRRDNPIIRHVATYKNGVFQSAVEVPKALSDPGRARILMALRGRELCVCQLIELLGLAPSTVSKHMTVLRQAGLVQSRKEGRWVYYRITDADHREGPVLGAITWLTEAVGDTPEIAEDERRLKEILSIDPEMLCRTLEEE